MKAYPRCPECGTRNISKNVENKHHYAVLCVECNKLYYQTAKDLNTNAEVPDVYEEIKPDHIDQVLRITSTDYPVPDEYLLPGKPVKRTTSQARIN